MDTSIFFERLVAAISESEIQEYLNKIVQFDWHPLGGNENNFGVIENQQASPIAALIEKLTNSIDAILMKRCVESSIDPKSPTAPSSMHHAIEAFFATDHKNWHLTGIRRKQAQSIQILASGSRTRPCLMIYDDGEGQHPEDFERTFLSLLQGNKNEIPFVQGKYNMGGTGAIVFCGEHRYQLIGSKRFDGTGDFGFTLVRKHPLSAEEKKTKKNTWYEYLKIDGKIPSFPITELDLGLAGRKFTTGTIIKLFDYQLPSGSRGGLPQEVRRSLNQFLFEPALPIYLKDSPERYPNNKVLEGDTFGLKRRLEDDDSKYIQEHFTDELTHKGVGAIKATCYVFRAKVDGKSVKDTRDAIDKEFFPDGMCVLFSLNGQVHGHLGTQFISGTLKMPLLKNHLLIHVDCTAMDYDFRSELFMASRDRLKAGDKTAELRQMLKDLVIKGRLTEIYKQRKNAISVEGGDAKDLLKSFSKNLPFNKELMRLLNQTFKIEQQDEEKKKKPDKPEKPKERKQKEPFNPKRYPSFFNLKTGGGAKFLTIPERDEKTIQFSTDVEDSYFDRSEDPGELKVSILQRRTNETAGGDKAGEVDSPAELLDIRKSSPKDGTIRIGLGATSDLKVGEELEIQATLGGPEDFECRFWVKIVEPNKEPKPVEKPDDQEEPPMGLPDYQLVYETAPEEDPNAMTWEKLGETGLQMDWAVPMHPFVGEDGNLEKVLINMDSSVLRNFVTRQGAIGIDQKELAEKKYISSVYFHTIFLFSITKNRKYELKQGEKDIDLQDYLRDVFSSHYSEFLLNFGMEDLISTMAD